MYIDTEAANRGFILRVEKSPSTGDPVTLEDSPLLTSFVGQDPPPSYLEATTPINWHPRPSRDEAARLLSYNDVRTPVPPLIDPIDGVYNGPTYRGRGLREHCSRARILKWLAALFMIILFAAIITVVTRANPKQQNQSVNGIPAQQAAGSQSQSPKDFPIRWSSRCGKQYNMKSEEFDFGSPGDLLIEEFLQPAGGPFRTLAGWVHVAQAPADQALGTIRAKISYAASKSVNIESIKSEFSATRLRIGDFSTSKQVDSTQRRTACLGLSVVLYVAPGSRLENFHVHATHLGMQVHHGVGLSVTNTTSISLTTGTLDASSLISRETKLETISGSISGKYALFDLIWISTISGSVNINVEPMEGGTEGAPAVFQAQSLSGSIRADFKRERIPARDYQLSLSTKVGSIDGTFVHGSRTLFQSVAGSITADILPFSPGDDETTIETDSRSGETKVKIQSPHGDQPRGLNRLVSNHKTISGAIDLTYPQEWEGHLDGSALSGALHLQGKDLELLNELAEPGKNHVEAKKGKGTSELTFTTISGACQVKVGRL
ncbi:uncharacterized protein EI97DRAFT_451029 [Westerdykella ornata]|uniref:Adhesin domain-containing protein n=1 Tax=Westerdykella ornata TaxID=318751 RepID=A0A6A6JFR8_WESOR|nr:uncharacterized protein EI97DRAFT_451029 [Westerdykella ornata]KAF2275470.1 hypothetical protein EI97DRAFT_451029 [Westerdykella ornata]